MKLNRKDVEEFLNLACKIIPKGNRAMPVTKTVLFDAPNQRLICTDLDVYVEMPTTITDYEKTVTERISAEENNGEEYVDSRQITEFFALDAVRCREIVNSLEVSDEIDISISEFRRNHLCTLQVPAYGVVLDLF